MKNIIILLFLASMCNATDTNVFFKVLETQGRNYTNATVKSFTPSHLTVYHGGGIARVEISDVSPEIQKQFGYNAEKATEYETEQQKTAKEKANKERQQKQMAVLIAAERWKEKNCRLVGEKLLTHDEMWKIQGTVLSVTDSGLLIDRIGYDEPVFVKCDSSGWTDGDRFNKYAARMGAYKYTAASGASKTVDMYDAGKPYISTNKLVSP